MQSESRLATVVGDDDDISADKELEAQLGGIDAGPRKGPGRPRKGQPAHEQAEGHRLRQEEVLQSSQLAEFVPGSTLEAPPPRPGYLQRWIRIAIRGEPDSGNIIKAQREGYRPRQADTLPETFKELSVGKGEYAGCVGLGDLVLFEVPKEIEAQRDAYYRRRRDRMTSAIESQLHQVEAPGHPIAAVNRTSVQVGKPSLSSQME